MSKFKGTPGPWSVRYDYVVQASSFDGGRLVPVAQPYGVNADGTDLFANARLIAAAPELLDALMELADWYREHTGLPPTAANAAIAKALGEGQP